MPTEREREYYSMGYHDALKYFSGRDEMDYTKDAYGKPLPKRKLPKRKLSAWNKFVKANSNKKIYQYANGKLKLKKMGIAYRKTRR